MHCFGYYLGITKQTEVLFLTFIGICILIFDTSLLELNANLQEAWAVELDPTKFSVQVEFLLKYIISALIIFQALSAHVFLALYIVMLWPMVCEDKPNLLLPWLFLGAARTVISSFIVFSLGVFTCSINGMFKPICADFFLSEVVKNAPSIYTWLCVLSYYKELKMSSRDDDRKCSDDEKIDFQDIISRRRRARSLADHQVFDEKADDGRNLLSQSTIENLLHNLSSKLNSNRSRSYDTLLQIMTAEAEKEEILSIYDDVSSVFDENLTIQEKAVKFLKLDSSDIERAKESSAARAAGGKYRKQTSDLDPEVLSGKEEVIKNLYELDSFLASTQRSAGKISESPFFRQFLRKPLYHYDLEEEQNKRLSEDVSQRNSEETLLNNQTYDIDLSYNELCDLSEEDAKNVQTAKEHIKFANPYKKQLDLGQKEDKNIPQQAELNKNDTSNKKTYSFTSEQEAPVTTFRCCKALERLHKEEEEERSCKTVTSSESNKENEEDCKKRYLMSSSSSFKDDGFIRNFKKEENEKSKSNKKDNKDRK